LWQESSYGLEPDILIAHSMSETTLDNPRNKNVNNQLTLKIITKYGSICRLYEQKYTFQLK
jgi:hypothetical protein